MKIDLNYLNRFGKIDIDEDVILDKEIYKDSEVRDIKSLHVSGVIEVNYEDDIILNLDMKATIVLPCAVSLQDVLYSFETTCDENLGKFEEILKNNKNILEISHILWENIVLEIPIRVVADGVEPSNTSGDGWELISE